jgi:hypothetical protein
MANGLLAILINAKTETKIGRLASAGHALANGGEFGRARSRLLTDRVITRMPVERMSFRSGSAAA